MLDLIHEQEVEDFLCVDSNLDVLESVLNRTVQESIALQRRKNELNFGEKLTLDRLVDIIPVVEAETLKFLDVSKVPNVEYSLLSLEDAVQEHVEMTLGRVGSWVTPLVVANMIISAPYMVPGHATPTTMPLYHFPYMTCIGIAGIVAASAARFAYRYFRGGLPAVITSKWTEDGIGLVSEDTVSVVRDIAHEYTHQIQYDKIAMPKKHPLVEGHANCVARAVARVFAEEYDNPAYIFESTVMTAVELNDAYLFACERKHRKSNLIFQNSEIPRIRNSFHRHFKSLFSHHHYSVGVAAMCIAEAKHGTRVYRDLLQGDYSFLRV